MILNFFILFFTRLVFTNAIEVSTSLGAIRGVSLKSRLGIDFYAFRGIRYAKSPVGELRFKSPQPENAWAPNVFDATDDGPRCLQPRGLLNSTEESEDCLRLNIYSKDLSASKPVMVYIHGGRFIETSAESKRYAGPEVLMDRDIVLVTFNYRLGAFGFLSTGTLDAPGNAGLKDQVMALKWVKKHIQNFGGNSDSVTLLGYDAGSISIGLHLVSPMSKGLFHKAIAMSGSPVSYWNYPTEQLEATKKLAVSVDCQTDVVDSMMNCLREKPIEKNSFEDFGLPVIEKELGQERFIEEEPIISFQNGRFEKVPLIIGMTKDEVVDIVKFRLRNKPRAGDFNDSSWNEPKSSYFRYSDNPIRSKEITALFKKKYLEDDQGTSVLIEPLAKFMSDRVIGFPVHRFAHLAAKYIPVYYYKFSYKGRFTYLKFSEGVFHYDDLQYLFHVPRLAPLFTKDDPENAMIERLTRMWTQFSKTGNPNNPHDEYLQYLNWKPLDLYEDNFLDIDNNLEVKNGLFLDRFGFWENIFPLNGTDRDFKHNCSENQN